MIIGSTLYDSCVHTFNFQQNKSWGWFFGNFFFLIFWSSSPCSTCIYKTLYQINKPGQLLAITLHFVRYVCCIWLHMLRNNFSDFKLPLELFRFHQSCFSFCFTLHWNWNEWQQHYQIERIHKKCNALVSIGLLNRLYTICFNFLYLRFKVIESKKKNNNPLHIY